ncbi:MAG: ATP-binding cassette domain-containing protein, partial [Clostridia bacterium]|nr:ATP-binding cassette domain-containing protein [Clostridia bacterium]
MDHKDDYVIEMLHITKEFPGIKANDDITLQLRRGEIHALLGENGAGKSTLMSVLFGLYQPEKGEILFNGKKVEINDPNDATALGIGMVHQHFKLVEVFTVLDNIILGAETTKMGFLRKKEAREKVKALSEKYGLYVDLDAKVEDITVGMQQRVEILKMLYRNNDILIFDEPTAVLTPQEIDELMATMKEFAKEGKSILFISHKLNEIMAVADRVTVL